MADRKRTKERPAKTAVKKAVKRNKESIFAKAVIDPDPIGKDSPMTETPSAKQSAVVAAEASSTEDRPKVPRSYESAAETPKVDDRSHVNVDQISVTLTSKEIGFLRELMGKRLASGKKGTPTVSGFIRASVRLSHILIEEDPTIVDRLDRLYDLQQDEVLANRRGNRSTSR